MKTFQPAGGARVLESPYAWMRLVISVVLGTIGAVGMWAVVVVLPAVQAEFGVGRAEASLPYTATMVGFAAGNVLVGRATDRLGYWLPALLSSVALGVGFLLGAMANSILQFTLAQGVLIGFGTAAIFGPLMSDISHWFDRRRGLAVTAAASGNYFAGALWPMAMPSVTSSSTAAISAGVAHSSWVRRRPRSRPARISSFVMPLPSRESGFRRRRGRP